MLPLLQKVVSAAAGTEQQNAENRGVLAQVLELAGRTGEAEALLRELIAQTAARGEFGAASAISGALANLLWHTGRPREALQVIEQKAEYTKQAGRGAWTQLADEVQRLQIRNELGEQSGVLRRVLELREQMRRLPDPPGANDWSVKVWNVRETTLNSGLGAACELGEWQQALDLNAEVVQSQANRGAGAFELAITRFGDFGPLLGLQRYGEARSLLLHCRDLFEQEMP